MTASETRMDRARYTDFMTLPNVEAAAASFFYQVLYPRPSHAGTRNSNVGKHLRDRPAFACGAFAANAHLILNRGLALHL